MNPQNVRSTFIEAMDLAIEANNTLTYLFNLTDLTVTGRDTT